MKKEIVCTNCARNITEEEISEAGGLQKDILDHLNNDSEPFLASMSLFWPDTVMKTTITKNIECFNCSYLIKNIKLDVLAQGKWSEETQNEITTPSFGGFAKIINIQLQMKLEEFDGTLFKKDLLNNYYHSD